MTTDFETRLMIQENKIKVLEEELNALKNYNFVIPKEEQFKVGWVYKNKKEEDVLILYVQDSKTYKGSYPLIGINLCTQHFRAWGACGQADPIHKSDAQNNLIHSTGRKWELE